MIHRISLSLCVGLIGLLASCSSSSSNEVDTGTPAGQTTERSQSKLSITASGFLSDTIVRAEGVLGLRMGQSLDTAVYKLQGEAHESSSNDELRYTLLDNDNTSIATIRVADSKALVIKAIEIEDTRLRTAQNIGVGSTLADLRGSFKTSTLHSEKALNETLLHADDIQFVLSSYISSEDVLAGTVSSDITVDRIILERQVNLGSNSADSKDYICYTRDDNANKLIWIQFGGKGVAEAIKYAGQSTSINLTLVSREYIPGGTQPTIVDVYNEIYEGNVNGRYELRKSGNWYYATYIRGSDKEQFKFTIDHTADNMTSQPCF